MKAAIIIFSPSGNTAKIGEQLKASLQQNGVVVQIVNITGTEKYFSSLDKTLFLHETIKEHDVLFVGSPVYAHHLQYHVRDLLASLPKPGNGWGKIAIPFVTYGGLNSGIALEEAGKLLKKSGRQVLAGLKVSCSHCMIRAFMEEEFNKDQPMDKTIAIIDKFVGFMTSIDLNSVKDYSKYLRYQSRKAYVKANLIFNEKIWHEKRYPKMSINAAQCIKCGKCVKVCPVCHLKQESAKTIMENPHSKCIHCFNCILVCPKKAVSPVGELTKARTFMGKMIKMGKEDPDTCLYPSI